MKLLTNGAVVITSMPHTLSANVNVPRHAIARGAAPRPSAPPREGGGARERNGEDSILDATNSSH